MKSFILLSILIFTNAFSSGVPKVVSQVIGLQGKYGIDSVVLRDPLDSDLPYYSTLEIFLGKKSVFKYSSQDLEIEGYQGNISIERGDYDNFYHVFRVSDRPSPDVFLVVQIIKGKGTLLGTTNNCTAEIFNDIDYDGIIEIGGLNEYYEGASTNDKPDSLFYSQSYSVFEIKKGFPIDTALTTYFRNLLINKTKARRK